MHQMKNYLEATNNSLLYACLHQHLSSEALHESRRINYFNIQNLLFINNLLAHLTTKVQEEKKSQNF